MAKAKKVWKGIVGDWTHIQGFESTGTLACLTDQQRQTLLTFIQVAYWLTRWDNPPTQDILDAFVAGIESSLMTDCSYMFSIRQTDCTIELLVGAVVVSSFELDAEACGLLNAGGEGTKVVAPGAIETDKKTELFSGAMALVIYCQEAILDAFNAIEIEIEIGKAATLWMETVPGLDLSPAYEVLVACDAFNEMLESVFETTDTPEWREEMSCKIMCWCVVNNYTFDASIIDQWREYLTDMGIAAPDYFYRNFVNVASYKALIDRFSLGMNDDDTDWITLCDTCQELIGQVTFDDEEDLDYEVLFGTVDDTGNPDLCGHGTEYVDTAPWPYRVRFEIEIELPTAQTVNGCSFDFNWYILQVPAGELGLRVELRDSSHEVLETWNEVDNFPQSSWQSYRFGKPPVESVKYVWVRLFLLCDCPLAKYIRVDNIQIFGPE